MIRNLFLSTLSVLALLGGSSLAQSQAGLPADKVKRIEMIVSSEMSRQNIPGLSIAVIAGREHRWSKGYGLADLENAVSAKPASVYRIASVSKPITATAVMQLVERGLIDLDAPAQKYCPAFPQKQWPVSVRQLLNHQSGIRAYKSDEETISTRHYTNIEETLDGFKDDPLQFEPGSKMAYTTYGYTVLGCVIEGASGMKYADYLRDQVFKPAGMKDTRAENVYEIVRGRVRGYSKAGGGLRNSVLLDVSYKIPGGGLISTVEDMARFSVALQNNLLVKRETLEMMWTRQKSRDGQQTVYGLGWFVFERNGQKEVGHGGDQQGTSAALFILPGSRTTVAVLANLDRVDTLNLVRRVMDALRPSKSVP